MKRLAILVLLCLGITLAAEGMVPQAHAQGSGEVVLAQNDRGMPNIFRFLFGDRRPQRYAPLPWQGPFEAAPPARREAARPRERRSRSAAPAPREVAAVEKAPDAKRVLVVGDFMARALAKGLAEAFAEDPNLLVIDASSGSSGLVRADYYDWPGKLSELVAEQTPDAVLAIIGANDRQSIRTDAGSFSLGTDEWRAAYTARVIAFADALKATGKPVLWVGLVPVSSSAMSRDYSAFNGIVREQAEGKGLRFIDTWNGFADADGNYVAVGPDMNGQSVQLRASDGLNFTRAGQRKLAFFVEQPLKEVLGVATPQLAAIDPTAGTASGEAAPQFGPMVPIEALSSAGGDVLSGAASTDDESGEIAAAISEGIAYENGVTPLGRADDFRWPPPPILPPAEAASSGAVTTNSAAPTTGTAPATEAGVTESAAATTAAPPTTGPAATTEAPSAVDATPPN
jgi:hypothetical protein